MKFLILETMGEVIYFCPVKQIPFFIFYEKQFSPPRFDTPERKLNSGTMKRRVRRPVDLSVCVGMLQLAGV